jgi:acylphosphatase
VGYRAFVDDEASALGLSGWVRNRRDGSVEALFCGSAAVVARMVEACRKGPWSARVDEIVQRDASAEEIAMVPGSFAVLPTA